MCPPSASSASSGTKMSAVRRRRAGSSSKRQRATEAPRASSDVETGRVTLAFAVVKMTAVKPGYLLIKNDPGSARPFPNCESSANCVYDTIEALMSRQGTGTVVLNCDQLGGCAIVGGR